MEYDPMQNLSNSLFSLWNWVEKNHLEGCICLYNQYICLGGHIRNCDWKRMKITKNICRGRSTSPKGWGPILCDHNKQSINYNFCLHRCSYCLKLPIMAIMLPLIPRNVTVYFYILFQWKLIINAWVTSIAAFQQLCKRILNPQIRIFQ